eukprot:6490779-Amphidinium_carterae.2
MLGGLLTSYLGNVEFHPLKEKLEGFVADAKKLIQDSKKYNLKNSSNKLDDAMKEMGKYANGMSDGSSWLSNYTGTDFQQLLAHASTTILLVDGDVLMRTQSDLASVLGSKEQCHAL